MSNWFSFKHVRTDKPIVLLSTQVVSCDVGSVQMQTDKK